MSCLTREQFVSLALGQNDDLHVADHIDSCAECQARLESARSLVNILEQLHASVEQLHQTSRKRLLDTITQIESETEVGNFPRATYWIGELTMRQRIALFTVSLIPMLGFMVLWGTFGSTPVSAMEEMAKQIREAKSYQLTMVQEMKWVAKPGKEPTTGNITQEMYWRAPNAYRWEMVSAKKFGGEMTTSIIYTDKPGIEMVPKGKSYRIIPARSGQMSTLMILQKLGDFQGEADRSLGAKMIGGIEAIGFEVDSKKIDSDLPANPVQIWLNSKSQLPVSVELAMQTDGIDLKIRFENIRWNLDLDPKLFDTTPPVGYSDKTPIPPTISEQVKAISFSLKTYAELMGGHYPRVKIVYGDVTRDELLQKIGVRGIPSAKQRKDPNYSRVQEAVLGFAYINKILRENSDAVWYGSSVGPEETDQVLLRWKLEDGTYRVIYGNLESENVTPIRLKQLEEK